MWNTASIGDIMRRTSFDVCTRAKSPGIGRAAVARLQRFGYLVF